MILSSTFVISLENSMTLLTISENSEIGGIANLFLEIRQGSGKVFIDTFPTSKSDTQITMRFAKEMACDFLSIDCSNLDFYYTIRASANIVGGPSAGVATTILTISLLDRIPLLNNVVITGTINSGGIIGPVGGIEGKVKAAELAGFEKILIPKWNFIDELEVENSTIIKNSVDNSINNAVNNSIINMSNCSIDSKFNFTIDNETNNNNNNDFKTDNNCNINDSDENVNSNNETLKNEGLSFVNLVNSSNIEIIKVVTLEEALYHMTGKNYSKAYFEFRVDPVYTETMMRISELLCNRTLELINKTGSESNEFYNKSITASDEGNYYSSASFCFSGNIELQTEILKNETPKFIEERINELKELIKNYKNRTKQYKLDSVNDLQTFIIVMNRLNDANLLINDFFDMNFSQTNTSNNYIYYRTAAMASERYYSAIVWSSFFNLPSQNYEIDEIHLRETCINKIGEAEERINYIDFYYPILSVGVKENIKIARRHLTNKEFAQCIFEASKVKAEANIISFSLGLDENKMKAVVDEKLKIVAKTISLQQDKKIFPILGYSYYEYAQSLKETDIFSSVLYAEYALELSNLGMYFKQEQKKIRLINQNILTSFIIGFCFGALFIILILMISVKKSELKKAQNSNVQKNSLKSTKLHNSQNRK